MQISTGADLYNRFQDFVEDTSITSSILSGWISQGLSEYDKSSFLTYNQEYTDVIAYNENSLPADFLSLERIRVKDNSDDKYKDYTGKYEITKDDHLILFEDLDYVQLQYNPVVELYSDMSLELPLRDALKPSLYYYCLAEYYLREGEGSTEEHRMGSEYRTRFMTEKARIELILQQREFGDTCGTTNVLPKRYKRRGRQNFLEYDGNSDVEV